MNITFLRLAVSLFAVAVLVIFSTTPVEAHADYERSDPAKDTAVTAAPQQVTVTFTQLLDPANSSLTVVDAAGTTVSQGTATVLANDGKVMQVALRSNLGPGAYTVRWETLSTEDGEDASGEFSFTVGSTAGTTPANPGTGTTPATTSTQLPNTGSSSFTVIALVVVGIAVALAGLALRRLAWLEGRGGRV